MISSPSQAADRVPIPWNGIDFGAASANDSQENASVFTLSGAGAISERSDRFHFVYQAVSGNFTATVRVGKTRDAAFAGIMLREALATTSHFLALGATANGEILSRCRNVTAPRVGSIVAKNGGEYSWLKIVKRGALAQCFFSADNGGAPANWKRIGARQPIASGMIYLGMCVIGSAPETVASAAFEHFALGENAAIPFDEGAYTLTPFDAPNFRLHAQGKSGSVLTIQNAADVPQQKWIFAHVGDGFYTVRPASNGALSLAVEGGKTDNKTPVILEENRDIAPQRWSILANANGTYSLMAQNAPGSGLDNFGGANFAGASQDIWQYNGSDSHLQWFFDFAD